jgi:hypothetical protein
LHKPKPDKPTRPERRKAVREPTGVPVRLFVLGPGGRPVAERFCAGVDISPRGIAVRTPGPLMPGSRVIVVMGGPEPEVWLACVAHVRQRPDNTRVLGLERLDMSEELARASWLAALRAAA